MICEAAMDRLQALAPKSYWATKHNLKNPGILGSDEHPGPFDADLEFWLRGGAGSDRRPFCIFPLFIPFQLY